LTPVFLAGCGGGGGDMARSPDRTPPVISLIGAPTINHEQGTDYIDQGATATDCNDRLISCSGVILRETHQRAL
jgi:hypothetical protein